MNTYTHLQLEDRIAIQFGLAEKKSHRTIANILGFHHSTISDEIKRNSTEQFKQGKYKMVYIAKAAHRKACDRRKRNASKYTQTNIDLLNTELKLHNSFENAAGKIRKEHPEFPTCQTLYKWFHDGKLKLTKSYKSAYKLTRRENAKKQSYAKSELCNTIHERPNFINDKKRFGDWDLDLMESAGGGGYMIAITEHVSSFAITKYIDTKHADNINAFLKEIMKKYHIKTLTPDNGAEFLKLHELITKENRLKIYYCDPGEPQQKGQVENFNKEMRRYIKKKQFFDSKSARKIQHYTKIINNKAKKKLNFNSPNDLEQYLKKETA